MFLSTQPSTEKEKFMSEALEQKMIESIDSITVYVNEAADFAAEQAPLVAVEMIRWGVASSAIEAVVCAAILFAAYKAVRWIHAEREDPKYLDDRDSAYFLVLPFSCAASGFFMHAVLSATKAIVSPRLFVLERLASLASGS